MIPHKVYGILVNILPMIVLFSIVMCLLKIVEVLYGHKKINIYKEFKYLLFVIYCFILFFLVTTNDFESFSNNFIPFREIMRYRVSSVLFYRNVIGNILIFVPFGYLMADVLHERVGKINLLVSAFISLFTSLTIEVIQMYIGRSFDIDDILLNFIGGIIGYLVYRLIHIGKKSRSNT